MEMPSVVSRMPAQPGPSGRESQPHPRVMPFPTRRNSCGGLSRLSRTSAYDLDRHTFGLASAEPHRRACMACEELATESYPRKGPCHERVLAGRMALHQERLWTWNLECAPQLRHQTTRRKLFHLHRQVVLRVQGGDFHGQGLHHRCPEPHKAHENRCVNLR